MQKDKLVGNKTGLAEQRFLAGTQEKTEFMTFGRKGRQIKRTLEISNYAERDYLSAVPAKQEDPS